MFTVAVLNVVVVGLAYLARYKRDRYLLNVSFVIVFIFLALRYDYGNDYRAYLVGFQDISAYPLSESASDSYFEIGWVYLNKIFEPFGFFVMVAALAALCSALFFNMIKSCVPPNYYWLAVFIYVFSPSLMLLELSAMRQTLSLCLMILSFKFIFEKKMLAFVIVISLASLFHTSALALLPIYFLSLWGWRLTRRKVLLLLVGYISLCVYLFYTPQSIEWALSFLFSDYQRYLSSEAAKLNSGLGLLVSSVYFFLLLYYVPYATTKEDAFFFKMAIIFQMLIPMSLLVGPIGRLSLYFAVGNVIAIPRMLTYIRFPAVRVSVAAVFILKTLYDFYVFFRSDIFKEAYGDYHTIISAPAFM